MIDGGAGRPALPNGRTNGIPAGRDVSVASGAESAAPSADVASDVAASPEPTSVQPSVEASADADIGLHSGYATYTAPLEADAHGLQMSFAGTVFGVDVSVVEPGEVFVKGTTRIRNFGLALDRAGGVGMSLDLHIAPVCVSFSGIAVQEIPSDYQDPSGYFSNPHFAGMWSHTVVRGAGDRHSLEWWRKWKAWRLLGGAAFFAMMAGCSPSDVHKTPFEDDFREMSRVIGMGRRPAMR